MKTKMQLRILSTNGYAASEVPCMIASSFANISDFAHPLTLVVQTLNLHLFEGILTSSRGSPRWIKVNERRTLHDVLKEPNLAFVGSQDVFAVFYVVSKRSSFYEKFKAGKWVPPSI
ncbi:hypothetical protein RJT34_03319 [Clitoria ternatea]|uniref:Uncharacterized protein n=1 Tax=Clitoria ternatea TaxID=43366 RepID=A0AAN9KKK8_CLITE